MADEEESETLTEALEESEFLAYRLLVSLEEQSGSIISRAKFLKLSSLAARYLEQEIGTEIEFPRYWYQYGEIAGESELSSLAYRSGQSPHYPGRSYSSDPDIEDSGWEDQARIGDDARIYHTAEGIETDDFDVPEEIRYDINQAVRWATQKFGKLNAEDIKRHQYRAHAPREFIRTYSELRFHLDESPAQQVILAEGQQENRAKKIVQLLDDMMMEYPDEFESLRTLYLRWDDTARMMLEQDSDYSELQKFLESFVLALSKAEIRFHHHHNIPESRLKKWEEEKEDVIDQFEREIDEARRGRLLKTSKEGVDEFEEVSKEFGKTVEDDLNELYNN